MTLPDKNLIDCPLACPNRKQQQMGKGYSFLFAIAVTALLGFSGLDLRYSKHKGLELSTKELSPWILVAGTFLIAGAPGINTDPLAQTLGSILSRK